MIPMIEHRKIFVGHLYRNTKDQVCFITKHKTSDGTDFDSYVYYFLDNPDELLHCAGYIVRMSWEQIDV